MNVDDTANLESGRFGDKTTPDRDLFERLACGDEQALGELARRYSLTLYMLAYEILRDSDAADRVVARTFQELKRDAVAGLADLFPVRWWLGESARSHARSLLRSREHSREQHPTEPGNPASLRPPSEDEPTR